MNNFRNLGELGEGTLRTWASQRGVAATKSQPDRNGWDFILEFPSKPDATNLPIFGENESTLRCVVQVKSSDHCTGKLQIDLKTWRYLSEFQLPSFFLILSFEHGDVPRQAFLVHVNEAWISRVTGRLINEKNSGRPSKNPSLTLKYSKLDELRILSGSGLEEAIRQHVGQSLDAYILRKINFLETIRNQREVRITTSKANFDETTPEEFITDLAVGLRKTLKVDRIEFFQKGAANPSLSQEGVELEIGERPKRGKSLKFKYQDTIITAAVEFSYGHTSNAQTQTKCTKFRFLNSYVDIVLCPTDPSKSSLSLIVPEPETDQPLQTWVKLGLISKILLDSLSSGSEIVLEIPLNNGESGKVELRSMTEPHPLFKALLTASQAAWTIAKYLDFHEEAKANLDQLLAQRQRLSMLADLLGPDSGEIKIGFQHPANFLPEGTRVCTPIGTEFLLGTFRFIFIFSIWGSLRIVARDGEMECYEISTFEKKLCTTYRVPQDENSPTLSQAIHRIADSATDDIPFIILECYS